MHALSNSRSRVIILQYRIVPYNLSLGVGGRVWVGLSAGGGTAGVWRAASKANGARSVAKLTWQGLDANIPIDSFEIPQEASDNSSWETATTTSTGSSAGSWTNNSGDDSDSA